MTLNEFDILVKRADGHVFIYGTIGMWNVMKRILGLPVTADENKLSC